MRFTTAICTVFLALACWVAPAMAAGQSVSGALVEALHGKGVIDDATYNDLKNTQSAGGEKALDENLVEVLHKNGVIDDATYQKLSEQAKAESAPVAATAPQSSTLAERPAGAAERPFDKALSSVEEGIARLGGDTVKLKIGTWTELGWVNDSKGSSTYYPGVANALDTTAGNNFHVRYARLYFNGTLAEKLGFRIAVDAAPTSGNILRDAYVWADYIPYTRATVGRFLTPYGDEVWRAPFDVPTINYAMASTFIQIPTARSTGLMLSGSYKTKVAGLPLGGGYAAALVNGLESVTFADNNDRKDLMVRAWVNPVLDGLSVGGSYYLGKSHLDKTATSRELNPDYDRWGAELDFQPTKFARGLFIRGEYLWQRRFFSEGIDPSVSLTKTVGIPGIARFVHSQGWYVTGAYRVNGLTGFAKYLNGVQPLVRYEQFDEDTAARDDSRTRTTVGVNYWLNKYARLMFDYEMVHAGGALRKFTLQQNDTSFQGHNVFTTHLQIWF